MKQKLLFKLVSLQKAISKQGTPYVSASDDHKARFFPGHIPVHVTFFQQERGEGSIEKDFKEPRLAADPVIIARNKQSMYVS